MLEGRKLNLGSPFLYYLRHLKCNINIDMRTCPMEEVGHPRVFSYWLHPRYLFDRRYLGWRRVYSYR